jgi:hypothetical protein
MDGLAKLAGFFIHSGREPSLRRFSRQPKTEMVPGLERLAAALTLPPVHRPDFPVRCGPFRDNIRHCPWIQLPPMPI